MAEPEWEPSIEASHIGVAAGNGTVTPGIEEAYRRSADLDARRVHVEATDGKVVLRGNVRAWAERMRAQQVAWAAPGVSQVENLPTVLP